jgi:hypothetical protein
VTWEVCRSPWKTRYMLSVSASYNEPKSLAVSALPVVKPGSRERVSTTSSALTRATRPRDGHPPRSSGVPSENTVTRRPDLSTPSRSEQSSPCSANTAQSLCSCRDRHHPQQGTENHHGHGNCASSHAYLLASPRVPAQPRALHRSAAAAPIEAGVRQDLARIRCRAPLKPVRK